MRIKEETVFRMPTEIKDVFSIAPRLQYVSTLVSPNSEVKIEQRSTLAYLMITFENQEDFLRFILKAREFELTLTDWELFPASWIQSAKT